jgi:hypothetical protein
MRFALPIAEYRCKLCKTPFSGCAEARACEKSHLRVKRARSLRFVRGPYPLTVEVEFKDGRKKSYIQEDEYWRK